MRESSLWQACPHSSSQFSSDFLILLSGESQTEDGACRGSTPKLRVPILLGAFSFCGTCCAVELGGRSASADFGYKESACTPLGAEDPSTVASPTYRRCSHAEPLRDSAHPEPAVALGLWRPGWLSRECSNDGYLPAFPDQPRSALPCLWAGCSPLCGTRNCFRARTGQASRAPGLAQPPCRHGGFLRGSSDRDLSRRGREHGRAGMAE